MKLKIQYFSLKQELYQTFFIISLSYFFVDTYGVCICIEYNHLNILVVGTNVFACGVFWRIVKVPIG